MKTKPPRKESAKAKYKKLPKLLEKGHFEEAEPLFDAFIAERSAGQIGYDNLISYARLKLARNKNSDAETAAMMAISVDEMRIQAPEFLLELYLKQKLYTKALHIADRLLQASPRSLHYRTNRLTVLSNMNQSDEVLKEWHVIREIDSEAANNPSVQHTVLNALVTDGRAEEAAEYLIEFKASVKSWTAWHALSEPHIYAGLGDFDRAIESLTDSVSKDPDNPVWQWNRGLLRLAHGDLVDGWKDYEVRWGWDDFPSPKRILDLPLWQGQDLRDRSIVISAEQGLGDQIMFSSILLSVLNMNPSRIRLEVQDKAIPIFKLWYPECEVGSWKNDREVDEELESAFDFHCPMATVCGLLMTSERAISQLPRRKIKISDQEKGRLLGNFSEKYDIKIGLSWRSSAIDGERASQYMNVNLCEMIIQSLPSDIGFVIVQYKFSDEERAVLEKYPNVFIPMEDLFDDVLLNGKYCATCDLVVSPATVVVQLCGLFGIPCMSWGAEKSWVNLGCDQPPWFGTVHQIKHKPNMSKGQMVQSIVNILKSSLPNNSEKQVH
ncbi:tetratricopeptide repeat protein [Litorivicinus sp.]|nr:tetratricopeptide repeat protein [Litorivicinus sp.]